MYIAGKVVFCVVVTIIILTTVPMISDLVLVLKNTRAWYYVARSIMSVLVIYSIRTLADTR